LKRILVPRRLSARPTSSSLVFGTPRENDCA
jgi:hypothetical protein